MKRFTSLLMVSSVAIFAIVVTALIFLGIDFNFANFASAATLSFFGAFMVSAIDNASRPSALDNAIKELRATTDELRHAVSGR